MQENQTNNTNEKTRIGVGGFKKLHQNFRISKHLRHRSSSGLDFASTRLNQNGWAVWTKASSGLSAANSPSSSQSINSDQPWSNERRHPQDRMKRRRSIVFALSRSIFSSRNSPERGELFLP
ncbi:MAG: hypothetical protein ABSE59_00430 [Opitutaceae bacterium]